MNPLYGAIEAGGTKFVCVLARSHEDFVAETRIDTTTPAATLRAMVEFFAAQQATHGDAVSFGMASFGPVQLDLRAADYGCILPTPKPGWTGADLLAPLRARFARPAAVETDVNAAALAEHQYGAGRGSRSLTYVTVGTGIGGGVIVNGQLAHGLLHPELGHIRVQRDVRDLQYRGHCPFHGDCLEGLACGPAISDRWGKPLDQLGTGHEGLEVIAGYLAQLAVNQALVCSSERVIFGGGVSQCAGLLPKVRAQAAALLNGYLPHDRYRGSMDEFIVAPGLGTSSGIAGAVLVARQALQKRSM